MEKELKVRCYDNGGKSYDRYTVVFAEKINGFFVFVGMSANPCQPLGFGQCDQSDNRIDIPSYSHLGKRIDFEKIPIECKNFVQRAFQELSANE